MIETFQNPALPKKLRVSFDFDQEDSWQLVDQLRSAGIEIIPTPVRALGEPEIILGTVKIRGIGKISELFNLSENEPRKPNQD